MISWQRYGYRMIGNAAMAHRVAVERRYLGAAASDTFFQGGSTTGPAQPGQVSGELGGSTPAVTLDNGATLPGLSLAIQGGTTPAVTASPCAGCTSPALAAAGGAVAGGLLMYFIGLATREKRSRRRA